MPFKYVALEIQKILDQENLPPCDIYEMIAEDMYRGRFSVSSRSQVLYWDEDVAQKITSENFERVLIPIIDALDDREEAIKFLIDRCWTRWDVLDRWCDKNKLPRIERWNSSPLSEESSAAPLQVDTSAEPMPPTKEELVTMGCNVLWPNGIPPISELKIHEMITDWVRQKIGDEKYTIGEGTRKRGVKKYREKLEANSLA